VTKVKFITVVKTFLFVGASIAALERTQFPNHEQKGGRSTAIKRPWGKPAYSPPPTADHKNMLSSISTHMYSWHCA